MCYLFYSILTSKERRPTDVLLCIPTSRFSFSSSIDVPAAHTNKSCIARASHLFLYKLTYFLTLSKGHPKWTTRSAVRSAPRLPPFAGPYYPSRTANRPGLAAACSSLFFFYLASRRAFAIAVAAAAPDAVPSPAVFEPPSKGFFSVSRCCCSAAESVLLSPGGGSNT